MPSLQNFKIRNMPPKWSTTFCWSEARKFERFVFMTGEASAQL